MLATDELRFTDVLITFWSQKVKGRSGRGTWRPVPAGYCTTWHYPDPAGYYFKIWPDPDPGNLCRFLRLSTVPHAVRRKLGICLATRLWCTTLWRHAWPIIAHLFLREAGQMTVYGGTF